MKLTRRAFTAMTATAFAGYAVTKAARSAAPAQGMPAGAIDSHNHIMGPQAKYPYAATRTYTPPEASVAQLKALRAQIGTARNVIVSPSVYGFDNSCTVDAIAELGDTARGVAVLPTDVSDAALRAFETKGIRGVRLRAAEKGVSEQLAAFAPRFVALNWHIQIVGPLSAIAGLAPQIAALKVPVVLDHFAGADGAGGVQQPGFGALLDLVRAGNTYVKLSAPYDRSKQTDYADMTPLARALIEAGPTRMLWGTNWPHPGQVPGRPISEMSPYQVVDNVMLAKRLADWCPDAGLRKTILVDTPQRLYRFA
jgi:predicted TIM-barrel fold metal-dependent hydrolase